MEIKNEDFKEIELFCPTYSAGKDMNFVAFRTADDFKIPVKFNIYWSYFFMHVLFLFSLKDFIYFFKILSIYFNRIAIISIASSICSHVKMVIF